MLLSELEYYESCMSDHYWLVTKITWTTKSEKKKVLTKMKVNMVMTEEFVMGLLDKIDNGEILSLSYRNQLEILIKYDRNTPRHANWL